MLGDGVSESDLLVHDEGDDALAFLLGTMQTPKFPTPIGVFRAVDRTPYDEALNTQVAQAKQRAGAGDLDELFNRGDVWSVD